MRGVIAGLVSLVGGCIIQTPPPHHTRPGPSGPPPTYSGGGAGGNYSGGGYSGGGGGYGGAQGGELHTGSTAGVWSFDGTTIRGAIPNDTGYSFYLQGTAASRDRSVTVTARVRYANAVDYDGIGVALLDPASTDTDQRNVRVELSQRQNHVCVGGWDGPAGSNAFGECVAAGRDVVVGQWYDLTLQVNGNRATAWLDGQEIISRDLPGVGVLPRDVLVVPFIIEADAEFQFGAVGAGAPAPAQGGELHTATTAGTWTATGATVRGAIPNDTGYSFYLSGPTANRDRTVTVTAAVRYASSVDYDGLGIALLDPSSTNTDQRNVRVELSQRQNHICVGGWNGAAGANAFGDCVATGQDIVVGQWYELTLQVDGNRVSGWLNGQQILSRDLPGVGVLPREVLVVPFIIEADAEFQLR